MPIRLRVTSLLAKNEGSYSVDAVPTGGANAILLAGEPTLTPMEMTVVERDLMRTYFGNSEMLPSSIYGKLDFSFEAAGSGTPGVVPAWGVIARACGMSETALVSALTGTAQVGGSTTSIKLAAGASAVNEFYNGMPISITTGTGAGQTGFIADYDGTTKIATVVSAAWVAPDATSQYSIGACVSYRRITDNPESATLYFNIDGVLHKFLGARGNLSGDFSVDKLPLLKAGLKGLFVPVADAVSPTAIFTAWKTPQVVNNANTPFARLHGYAAAIESFNFDLGNDIVFHSLINSTEQMLLANSKPKCSINMEATTVAQKNWWDIAKTAALGAFAIQHGTVAGNKFAAIAPAMQLVSPNYGNKNGIGMMKADLIPQPLSGNDELILVTF